MMNRTSLTLPTLVSSLDDIAAVVLSKPHDQLPVHPRCSRFLVPATGRSRPRPAARALVEGSGGIRRRDSLPLPRGLRPGGRRRLRRLAAVARRAACPHPFVVPVSTYHAPHC